jgi:hypothetical protein
VLTQFPHLQKLHLQNTPIGDEAISYLEGLAYLNILNLSGTKISAKALDEISKWKNLKKLYLYNTLIPDESLRSLEAANNELEVFNTQLDLTDSLYNAQLTIPVCKIDSLFFRQRAFIEVKLSRGKVKYFYTLDGTEPNAKSNLYTEPFHVDKSCEFRIIATMEGWIDSKVASFQLLRMGMKPQRITFETKPTPKYVAKLDTTLFDGNPGSLNRGDREYVGFTNQNVRILFQYDEPKVLSSVTVSFLEDVDNGIVQPDDVEVWGGEDKNTLKIISTTRSNASDDTKTASKGIILAQFPGQRVRFVRVHLKHTAKLPTGSSLIKNNQGSIFLDEISLH